jgi:co-chaperonin GroES (HSP10)
MQFRPLHDRVVVRRVDEEERTKGGITRLTVAGIANA